MRTQFFSNELKALSLSNKGKLYRVSCFNYCDKNRYYLKDGKLALAESFNENYAFAKDSVRFSSLPKHGIYTLALIKDGMDVEGAKILCSF